MNYKQLGDADIAYLRSLVDPERILVGEQISEDYSHDELAGVNKLPDVLIKAHTTEEIAAIMKYANEQLVPVVVRGSGTGLVGASVPLHGGIMIETLEMNNILELDSENLTVTVEPGVLLMQLAEFAESHGFLYPPDPGEKTATIAGNISTNAGGMRAVKYGVTRDYVRALELVLPTGDVLELGGKVVKNSTGYSLKDLIIGSEGTLAIITKATLKLIPLPAASMSILIPFEDIDQAIKAVPEIIKTRAAPTALEFMQRETILFAEEYLDKRFPESRSQAYLLLTFDGADKESVRRECESVADLCIELGAPDAYYVDTAERKDAVWSARGAFLQAINASTDEMDECDVVVPRSRLAEFLAFAYGLSKELDVRIPGFGHAGDGNLHLYVCRDGMDEARWKPTLETAFKRMYDKAYELGGLVSGEHGIGFAKMKYMETAYGEKPLELMRGIKRVFDPNNILNPDKLF